MLNGGREILQKKFKVILKTYENKFLKTKSSKIFIRYHLLCLCLHQDEIWERNRYVF